MFKTIFFMTLSVAVGAIYGSVQMYHLDAKASLNPSPTRSTITFTRCAMPQRVVFVSRDAVRVARWRTVQVDTMLRRLYVRLPNQRVELGCWKLGGKK